MHGSGAVEVDNRRAGRHQQYTGDRLVHWRKIRDALVAGSPERARAAGDVTAIEADMMIPETSAAAGVPYVPTP